MRTLILTLFSFFLLISCEGQIISTVNVKRVEAAPTSNSLAVAIIGDSNADGSASILTTCAPGTLYRVLKNGTTYEITDQSVANDGNFGSIWHPFATEYKSLTGDPVLLMNGAKGGSSFYTSTYDWNPASGDTLYSSLKTRITNGLAANGKAGLDAIIMNLGINDVRASFTYANITTAAIALFDLIETDFPGVPVLIIPVGRTETSIQSTALYDLREFFVDQCNARANFHMMCQPASWAFMSGWYEPDAVHYTNLAQVEAGKQLARWFVNRGTYSKWGNSVISSHFDDISTPHKVLVDNFMISQVANGNYFRMDELHFFKTSDVNNIFFDWTFLGFGVQRTSTFAANDAVSTNGTTGYYDMAYVPNSYARRATQSNILSGVKVKTRSSTGSAYLFATFTSAGSAGIGITQQASPNPIRSLANDGTFTNGTDVFFQADNLYSSGRSSGNKYLYKNSTLHASAAVATTGTGTIYNMAVGAVNSSGVRSAFLAGSYEYSFVSEYNSFDLSSFYNDAETLVDGW